MALPVAIPVVDYSLLISSFGSNGGNLIFMVFYAIPNLIFNYCNL